MQADGINPTFHYVPLHSSEGGRRFAARPTECPVTDEMSGRLLRLPFYNNLSPDDAERVVTSFLTALATIVA
jgi:dTDP-4-amino-4,6-dideoxygalactose transaminase